MPRLAVAGTGPHAEMFVAAARGLRWEIAADPDGADLVVVDGPVEARRDTTLALLASGVDVVLAPGLDTAGSASVADEAASARSSLVIGEPFPTAPAVQRWFGELGRLGTVEHLSGRAARTADEVRLDWPLLAVTLLSARLAGWGEPDGVDVTAVDVTGGHAVVRFASGAAAHLDVDVPDADRPPHWELQAASATGALRVEMLPRPSIERDGAVLPLPPVADPAERFGVAPLLRAFRADIEAGRRPVLDARFGARVERLREQLSRTG